MVKLHDKRQAAIRSVLRGGPIRTQEELMDALVLRGYDCAQTTISRDVGEMGLRKVGDGFYIVPEDVDIQRLAREFVTGCESVGNLVVVKCAPNMASAVADAIDETSLAGIAGSVGDNDTALVACRTEAAADAVVRLVERFRSE